MPALHTAHFHHLLTCVMPPFKCDSKRSERCLVLRSCADVKVVERGLVSYTYSGSLHEPLN